VCIDLALKPVYVFPMNDFELNNSDYTLIRAEETAKAEPLLRRGLKAVFSIFVIGLLFVFVSFFYGDDIAAFIFFFGFGLIMIILSIALFFKVKASSSESIENSIEERVEEARLEFLKSKMTLAEWENYKIQLENNALLKNIKTNQNRNTRQGPGISYGVIDS